MKNKQKTYICPKCGNQTFKKYDICEKCGHMGVSGMEKKEKHDL